MFQSVGTAQVQSSDAQQPAADDKKPAKAISKKPITKEDTGDAYKILIKPLITEKITALSANNQYGFLVADSSNKIEIKKAISKVYGVTPVKVRIIRVKGKRVRTGKIEGKTKKWKKALITLKPGDKIEIYESVK
ncbi:50S ribosomal protein L23 [Patescibacteria group bacterium]|nr:50S ribosomal protein L23 [Patescibacteria group bacterium]